VRPSKGQRQEGRRGILTRTRVFRRIELGDLGIGGTIPEVPGNGWTIRPPRIGTHLRGPVNTSAQIFDEIVSISRIPLTHMEGRNHFADRIERNVSIGISKLRIGFPLWRFHDAFLLLDEGPDFVALDRLAANSSHLLVQHLPAPFSYLDQQPHDGFLWTPVMRDPERIEQPSVRAEITASFFSGFSTFMGPPWMEIPEGVYLGLPLLV